MAKFKKGRSGNPAGKPRGAKNKVVPGTKEFVREFLIDNRELFKKDWKKLTPLRRAQLYVSLIPYDAPKMQTVSNSYDFDNMPEEMLDKIIEGLRQAADNE